MKFRLTPLNIITAIAFALFVVVLFRRKPEGPGAIDLGGIYQLMLGALVAVAFISDMIFRFTLKDLKRIWIVEIIFIALTIILFLILQK
jgi:hypothetical protein